jgi:hypothetical protein
MGMWSRNPLVFLGAACSWGPLVPGGRLFLEAVVKTGHVTDYGSSAFCRLQEALKAFLKTQTVHNFISM